MSETSTDKEPIEMPHPDVVPDGFLNPRDQQGSTALSATSAQQESGAHAQPDVEVGPYITQVPLTDAEQTLERELLERFGPQGCHDCND